MELFRYHIYTNPELWMHNFWEVSMLMIKSLEFSFHLILVGIGLRDLSKSKRIKYRFWYVYLPIGSTLGKM